VRTPFDYFTLVEDDDFIRCPDRTEPVSDYDDGAASGKLMDGLLDVRLGFGIK
jgi:hypothetical protein